MCTLRLELPLLEVQRAPPHDLTKTVIFEQYLSLIWEGFETALQNRFLVPHPMLLIQSYRRNSISKVELWKNRPFSGELLGFGLGGFLVRSSTAFMQNLAKLHENVHIKVRAPSPWCPKRSHTGFDKNYRIWSRFKLILRRFWDCVAKSFSRPPPNAFSPELQEKSYFKGWALQELSV